MQAGRNFVARFFEAGRDRLDRAYSRQHGRRPITVKCGALLRGINVAGANKIKMADLARLFAGLGHTDIQTYLQSGNVVFSTTTGADPENLVPPIEKAILNELGLTVTVLLRTGPELAQVLAGNPYLNHQDDLTKLHVTFLANAPDPDRASAVQIPSGESAKFTLAGREVYLHCPDGYGRTKLNNAFFEKKLSVPATTRNWRSVIALHDLTSS
jgi:uncharacterized protein (DUF1697 family)